MADHKITDNKGRYARPNRGEAHKADRGKNSHRFRSMAIKREPLSSEVFDMEFNYLVYALNEIDKGKNPLNPPIDAEGKLVWIGHDSKEIKYDKLAEHMVQDGGLSAKKVITDKTIENNKLADNCVHTINIKKDAVTGDEIKDKSVPFGKMTGKVGSANIATDAIKSEHIEGGAVTSDKISSVHGSKIQDSTITTKQLGTGAVLADNIANNIINANKISSVNASAILGTIDSSKISGKVASASHATTAGTASYANNLSTGVLEALGKKIDSRIDTKRIKTISRAFITVYARQHYGDEEWKALDLALITKVNGDKIYGTENYYYYAWNETPVTIS